jgi:hypothetical protein
MATGSEPPAMATMTDDPYLNHVPVMTGGIGYEQVRRFYGEVFIGHWPASCLLRAPLRRTRCSARTPADQRWAGRLPDRQHRRWECIDVESVVCRVATDGLS